VETPPIPPNKDEDKPKVEEAIDPMILDYAESLKKKLGDNYTKDLDTYDVRQRIEIMKHMVIVAPKHATKSPFPKPTIDTGDGKKIKKLPIKGIDWRKYKNN